MASKHVLILALAAAVTVAGCAALPASGFREQQRSVLSAESQVLKQRHLAADLQAREFDYRIELVRTLGGGFEEQ